MKARKLRKMRILEKERNKGFWKDQEIWIEFRNKIKINQKNN